MSDLAEEVAERGLPTDEESVKSSDNENINENSVDESVISKIYSENTKLWAKVTDKTRNIERLEWENAQLSSELEDEMELRTKLVKDNNELVRRIQHCNRVNYICNIGFILLFIFTSFW